MSQHRPRVAGRKKISICHLCFWSQRRTIEPNGPACRWSGEAVGSCRFEEQRPRIKSPHYPAGRRRSAFEAIRRVNQNNHTETPCDASLFFISHLNLGNERQTWLSRLSFLDVRFLGFRRISFFNDNRWHPYSPPVFGRDQLLHDVLQGDVPLRGAGDAVGAVRHGGGRLQDDLEGLARGPFIDGLDVHVCDA